MGPAPKDPRFGGVFYVMSEQILDKSVTFFCQADSSPGEWDAGHA